MKRFFGLVIVSLFIVTAAAFTQRGGAVQHRGNGGHIPPPPPSRSQGGKPEIHTYPDGQLDQRPHVANDHWYGHDDKNDARYQLAKPYPQGRFEHFGPTVLYRVGKVDMVNHRFWFMGGFGFEIALWDWPFAAEWCWNCPDDIVVYDDPDHMGWYLIYNTETGVYVHAQYLGT